MAAVVDSLLTEQLKKEYEDIYPLIWLTHYRIDVDGRDRLLEGEWNVVPSLPRRIIKKLVYHYEHMRSHYDKSQPTIMMSECFWDINRYDDFMNQILDKYNVIGTLSIYMCNPLNLIKLDALRKKVLRARVAPVGQRLVSYETKVVVNEIFDLFTEMIKNGTTCADCMDQSRQLFDRLRVCANVDIEKMVGLLKKYNVQQFITINEYNLPDYITILACKRLGIRTKEMLHYWFQEAGQEDHYGDISIVDQHMFWNEEDLKFMERFEHYENGYDAPIRTVCGCPEVTREILTQAKKDIDANRDKEKTITLLVPGAVQPSLWGVMTYMDYFEMTPLAIREVLKYWEDLFKAFKELEKNSGYRVLLRFHPTNERLGYVEYAKPLVEKYGFERIPTAREGLFDSIKRSDVIFSFSSSSLFVGYILGCKCYNLDYHKIPVRKDFSNLGMQTVEVSELPNLQIPQERDEPRFELCVNLEKVFEL